MDVLFAADVLELKCPMERVPGIEARQGLEVVRSVRMIVVTNVAIEGIMLGIAADTGGVVAAVAVVAVEIDLAAAQLAVLATVDPVRDPAAARGRADLDLRPRRAGAVPVPRRTGVQDQDLVLVADLLQRRTIGIKM